MACPAGRQQEHSAPLAGGGQVLIPVIVDSGDDAAITLVSFPHTPRLGDRFSYSGCTWEITHTKSSLRGYVAHPVVPRARAC